MQSNKRLADALMDPAAVFSEPRAVLAAPDLSDQDKLAVLKRWEQDARELEVAEEEGMLGEGGSRLADVIKAIESLAVRRLPEVAAPDKHGYVVDWESTS